MAHSLSFKTRDREYKKKKKKKKKRKDSNTRTNRTIARSLALTFMSSRRRKENIEKGKTYLISLAKIIRRERRSEKERRSERER